MSKRAVNSVLPVTSPKLSTAPGSSLRDFLPGDGRDLPGEVMPPGQVCVNPSAEDSDYDVSFSLPELVGFPDEFCKALELLVGVALVWLQNYKTITLIVGYYDNWVKLKVKVPTP